jgi:hypothetical protein
VRTPVIETGSSEWRSDAWPSSYARNGGKWTESNLLPVRDRGYGAAAAPACPYWHFPFGSRPASRTLPVTGMSRAGPPGLPASNGGWLRVRTPYLSVSVPVFKTGCRPLQRSHPDGCPGAIRTRGPRLRRAVLWSTELRDMMVGVPGYDPGRLQPSAAPAYKAEPHASADAVVTKMVRASGFEPLISCVRGTRFCRAKLHPDEMATCTGIEPVSLDRQPSRLARCVTGHEVGVLSETRTRTVAHDALNVARLPVPPRARGGHPRQRSGT